MSGGSNDHVAPPPTSPPEINFSLPRQSDFATKLYDWPSAPTEILLITANDHEFAACYFYVKNVQRSYCNALGMVDFGQFGDGVRVALMKCAQGPTEAVIAVKNAAEKLHPKVVLFVGICASMKPTEAKLGDVVISAKLATYADRKVSADGTEYRGTKAKVSRNMARLILHAADGWEPPLQNQSSLKVDVHRDAVMLSGPELVDNTKRREELAEYFRDALGLEMEGAGLYAAAHDLQIEWAVIKAVSDFADGSKSVTKEWQPFASVMAASLVHNMFKHANVILKQWPHNPGISGEGLDIVNVDKWRVENAKDFNQSETNQNSSRGNQFSEPHSCSVYSTIGSPTHWGRVLINVNNVSPRFSFCGQSQLPTEILLITANDHEFAACYSYMKNVQRGWHDTLGMVDFGQFDDEKPRVALMKCPQGPTEAVIAVKNAAEILYPKVVLFVGICATLKPAKAKLGDVVISAKLATYANVSRYMARRILSAADGWKPPLQDQSSLKVDVHRDAVMLSGPELVDNLERRQELSNNFQEALGLEMEGAGLYAAAYDLGIEWAVIKAVSDFGDGSKSVTKDWQPFASVMAASVVHNMFKEAHVIKKWPHYKNFDPGMAEDTIDAKNENEKRTQMKININAERNHSQIQKCVLVVVLQTKISFRMTATSGQSIKSKSVLSKRFASYLTLMMSKQCGAKGGTGIAEVALQKWGTGNRQHNVGALKKIVEETMARVDVINEIENWEQLCVCHGCGNKLK
ncbi:5 -methylthioadenosine S-adenosylhomocysteine nucleosidase-like isoform X16 [Paramuricea clavata]|uniref:5 -methylthioadenosine S-adenosylhomocysteine nucleosidase-like isoform X16 n=1 Tax=Paramuricea clavata TaxID=317549 RepID=A0A7D9HXE2_PARCT|nr:5 -methylthioadenosine S-adenosylhomocysteine nucleosidase-like isoform X16 [Paramuricea clavata]